MGCFAGIINKESPIYQEVNDHFMAKGAITSCLDADLGWQDQEKFKLLTSDGLSNLLEYLQDKNTFLVLPSFLDEKDIDSAATLKDNLFKAFKVVQSISRLLLDNNKKANFVFMTSAPGLYGLIDYPFSPIYDLSIHSFVKSLAKELTPMGLSFYCLCCEPLMALLPKSEIRQYRNKMRVVAAKKIPLKTPETAELLHNICFNYSSLLSGSIITAGSGSEILL
tara:strand:- start:159 stop:827 length:669 start_codon:yes stop_codon:yes gene_type:complete